MINIKYNFEMVKNFTKGIWSVSLKTIETTDSDIGIPEITEVQKTYDITFKQKDDAKEFISRVVNEYETKAPKEHVVPITIEVIR